MQVVAGSTIVTPDAISSSFFVALRIARHVGELLPAVDAEDLARVVERHRLDRRARAAGRS